MRKYNNAFKGFTLIELVAVMVIGGILIVAAGPFLNLISRLNNNEKY
jgi:prepilin-type N-terminal cleavage/methylation domain-containing protein